MALWSTQRLTEINTKNLSERKRRSAHKAERFAAIREPIV
jgi:hypothetical protein